MPPRRAPSLEQLLGDQTHKAWLKIRQMLDVLPELAAQVERGVEHWPADIHRPPLKHWRSGDARLRCCRNVRETALYNDYILAVCSRIKTKAGMQAVQLERQYVGKVLTAAGIEMLIGIPGQADLKGGVILEWGGYLLEARLEVEIKMESGTPSKEQLERQTAFGRRGGCYVIAFSVDSAVEQVLAWKHAREREVTGAAMFIAGAA
jgi:hypothetical protein